MRCLAPRDPLATNAAPSGRRNEPAPRQSRLRPSPLLWPLLFCICFGLGYPTLNRVDPHRLPYDARAYYELVVGAPSPAMVDYSQRVLVPYVARPFYWLVRNHVGSWDPVLFGLLVSNSLFFATAAWMLADIGCTVLGDQGLALLGAMLYLLNFASANFILSGMVDSSQAFVIVACTRALMTQNWGWLPALAFLGALTKETTVPLSLAFASGWWLESGSRIGLDWRKAGWIAGAAAVGFATLAVLMSQVSRYSPWSFAVSQRAAATHLHFYLAAALKCVFNHEFLYVFVWLLPLGLLRLRDLPRSWAAASLAGALTVVAMAAYSNALGNTARPLFNVAGPLLSLAAALSIGRMTPARLGSRTPAISPER
jgi:hypothetical protein